MVLTKAIDKGELRYLIKTDAYRDWNAKFFFLTITNNNMRAIMDKTATIDFFYNKNEDWESTYNNQNFFEYNLQRMRYLVVDTTYLKNNPFEGCVDLATLEVKNSMQFERLKQYTHEDLQNLCEVNEWDWLGDDFEHMWQYLNFIQDHDKDFNYNTRIQGEDEYMQIHAYKIPEKYRQGALREAYLQGQIDAEQGLD